MNKYLIGFQLLIVGMGTVLLTLYLLSLFIRLTGRLFGPSNKDTVQDLTGTEIGENNKIIKNEERLNQRKVAAISAALYQTLDHREYRIISIKKQGDSAWKL